MSDEILVRQCAPTLAGLKTGNIFPCRFKSHAEQTETLKRWNCMLKNKGLRALPLKSDNERSLIYVYRPERLNEDLKNEKAAGLLAGCGYSAKTGSACVACLRSRMMHSGSFPHEVGLFIGYPPEDVIGFIENRAAKSKCVGCWKVYGDVEKAEAAFRKFKKCTGIYCRKFAEGTGIEKLAVNI